MFKNWLLYTFYVTFYGTFASNLYLFGWPHLTSRLWWQWNFLQMEQANLQKRICKMCCLCDNINLFTRVGIILHCATFNCFFTKYNKKTGFIRFIYLYYWTFYWNLSLTSTIMYFVSLFWYFFKNANLSQPIIFYITKLNEQIVSTFIAPLNFRYSFFIIIYQNCWNSLCFFSKILPNMTRN